MSRAVPVEVRRAALQAVRAGREPITRIARRYRVSVPSLKRWRQREERGEGIEARAHGGGRPPVLTPGERKVLVALLVEHPQASLAEVLAEVQHRLGKAPSVPTARRYLKELGVRRRKPHAAAAMGSRRSSGTTHYRAPHRRTAVRGYPSDMTDAEWAVLAPIFTRRGGAGRPSLYGERALLNAIFYVVRSGCTWRMLPHDFPPWPTVYAAFRRWHRAGRFEEAHDTLRRMWRMRAGRNAEPTGAIIDSQSVKTTEKGGLKATTAPRR